MLHTTSSILLFTKVHPVTPGQFHNSHESRFVFCTVQTPTDSPNWTLAASIAMTMTMTATVALPPSPSPNPNPPNTNATTTHNLNNFSTSFKNPAPPSSSTFSASSHVEALAARKDSRMVEYHIPIPEEDESVGTESEPAEPLTPTSDITPSFSHPFRHDDPLEGVFVPSKQPAMARLDSPSPLPPTSAPAPAPQSNPQPITRTQSNNNAIVNTRPPPVNRSKSTNKPPSPPSDQSALEKPGLGKRVGSFMRNKLHRTPSKVDANAVPGTDAEQPANGLPQKSAAAKQTEKLMRTEKLMVNTGVDGPKEVSSPTIVIPKYRRLSSFSLSGRNSPKSMQNNSPPSPSSPSSTVSDEAAAAAAKQKKVAIGGKHSISSTALSSLNKRSARPGVTWAGSNDGKKSSASRFTRRRSASSEAVPKMEKEENTVGLIDTFSKAAVEGVGMKARRLSLSLPDEFVVDSCELEKEFKSSSLMPGKRGKCLGRGATAEVRIMARRGPGIGNEDLVAVKEFRIRERDEDEEDYIKKIKSEYCIAKSLHHPNVVETIRLCTNRGRWNHVMEFCAHGELFSLVERKLFAARPDNFYSAADRLCFFKQLLRGVDYLHSHGIAHRDIKLENLLLDKEGHLKISDFGVAEVFSGEHPGLRASGGECGKNMGEIRLSTPGICGSLPYIAPEVLEKKDSYDPRPLDIWSCAIVFCTMTFGGSPWEAAKPEFEYYARFKKGWDEWLPRHPDGQLTDGPDGHPKCGKLMSLIQPPPVKRLILKMLHPNPSTRITIKEIMASNCVKSIDCCCPESYNDPACSIDTSKFTSKQISKMTANKKMLHHHIPPQPEKKFAKMIQHRFDMGDGYQ